MDLKRLRRSVKTRISIPNTAALIQRAVSKVFVDAVDESISDMAARTAATRSGGGGGGGRKEGNEKRSEGFWFGLSLLIGRLHDAYRLFLWLSILPHYPNKAPHNVSISFSGKKQHSWSTKDSEKSDVGLIRDQRFTSLSVLQAPPRPLHRRQRWAHRNSAIQPAPSDRIQEQAAKSRDRSVHPSPLLSGSLLDRFRDVPSRNRPQYQSRTLSSFHPLTYSCFTSPIPRQAHFNSTSYLCSAVKFDMSPKRWRTVC